VAENQPTGIAPLLTQTQLVQALRQAELAAERVIDGLSKRNLKELRGSTQLLPQFSSAGIGVAPFRRRDAFDDP